MDIHLNQPAGNQRIRAESASSEGSMDANVINLSDLCARPGGDQHTINSPMSDISEGSADGGECTICFEQRPFVNLPCKCTLNYCAMCWDRALAASVTMRGRAQCPSCRMAFRVDFDPDTASLVFTQETEVTTLAEWRQRLYKKAKPVQIRLLQDFRASNSVDDPVLDTGAFSKAQCSPESVDSVSTGVPSDDSQHSAEPLCVCGDVMEKIDRRTRILRMLDDTEPGWRTRVAESEKLVESLASSSLITCDLCDEVAMRTGFVWTCRNGPHTVLHPVAYDVCEKCFDHYAGSVEPPPATTTTVQTCAHSSASGCCQNCASALFRAVPWPQRIRRRFMSTTSGRARRGMAAVVMGLRSNNQVSAPSTVSM